MNATPSVVGPLVLIGSAIAGGMAAAYADQKLATQITNPKARAAVVAGAGVVLALFAPPVAAKAAGLGMATVGGMSLSAQTLGTLRPPTLNGVSPVKEAQVVQQIRRDGRRYIDQGRMNGGLMPTLNSGVPAVLNGTESFDGSANWY